MGKYRWVLVLTILLIAFVFRFQHIISVPPGLYPDEAMNGNNALNAISNGDWRVFYPENNGREGLFINLQALSLMAFGNVPWALRIVSAIFGMLTVWGVYFLAKKMFNWQIGAIASFFLAISFWHTLFSRIGFRAIMAPFFAVWGMYFLWRALADGRFRYFAISGIFWGLGFYSYISFRVMPLVVILILLAYWQTIKKDFDHDKYIHIRNLIARGSALLMVTAIIVFLPLGLYFYNHPGDFFGRTGQLSVFASENILDSLSINIIKTFGMFNFTGDWNWRHNLAGAPLLFWPVGIMFAAGFLRSWFKLMRSYRKHRHFSTVQVALLSWFLVGLLPVIVSNEGLPHALRAIIVSPVVFIFAAEGLWWFYETFSGFYRARDFHVLNFDRKTYSEGSIAAGLAVILLLSASAIGEYNKYFNEWAKNANTPPAFAQNYVDIGNSLNKMPRELKKYVLVNAGGILVNGIPMPSQTVMFITDTWTPEKQNEKNIYYLTQDEFNRKQFDKNGIVIPLEK